MPTLDDVKRAVCETIDRQSEKIVTVGETIRKSPELGFKEFKTPRTYNFSVYGRDQGTITTNTDARQADFGRHIE